jgi:hypothetical protein
MTTKNKTSAADKVRSLVEKFNAQDEGEALFLTSRLLDVLFYSQALSYSENPTIKIANFVASVADVPWRDVQFSLADAVAPEGRAAVVAAQYGAKPDDIPRLLLEALAVFSDLLAAGGVVTEDGVTSADIFDAVVAELAENSQKPKAPELKAPPAEICSPNMVKRVFTPKPFSLELAGKLQMTLVHYEGIQGNDMRALAFDSPGDDEAYMLFLETGECLEAKKNDCSLAVIDEESYENVPAALLAFIVAAVTELEMCEVIRPDTARAIEAGALGEFTTDICTVTVRAEDLQPLTHVIDTAREASSMGVTGATGPVGALLRFPVPNVPGLFVVLEAQVGATGPYVLARLVDSSAGVDRVLMRLDQPRHDAVKGLYLFPHAKQAVVLKA